VLNASTEYEITVSGLVPEAVRVEIEGFHAVIEPVQSILRGPDEPFASVGVAARRRAHP
jgi:hypothetical protein